MERGVVAAQQLDRSLARRAQLGRRLDLHEDAVEVGLAVVHGGGAQRERPQVSGQIAAPLEHDVLRAGQLSEQRDVWLEGGRTVAPAQASDDLAESLVSASLGHQPEGETRGFHRYASVA